MSHQKLAVMKKLSLIDERAKSAGLVFAILFSLGIAVMAVPFGAALESKDYIQLVISSMYPIGLFIGLKWKGLGALVCLVGLAAFMVAYISDPSVSFTYSIQIFIFWTVLFLFQMIPVTYYILSWYYHRQSKVN